MRKAAKLLIMISGASPAFLIDTNIVVAIQCQEVALIERLAGVTILLSAVVLGELYFGAHHSNRTAANIASIQQLAYPVLHCDESTAAHYGRINSVLRLSGRPIPDNDIWIAAQAVQHNLTVVTRDAHFQHVQNLSVQTW